MINKNKPKTLSLKSRRTDIHAYKQVSSFEQTQRLVEHSPELKLLLEQRSKLKNKIDKIKLRLLSAYSQPLFDHYNALLKEDMTLLCHVLDMID